MGWPPLSGASLPKGVSRGPGFQLSFFEGGPSPTRAVTMDKSLTLGPHSLLCKWSFLAVPPSEDCFRIKSLG